MNKMESLRKKPGIIYCKLFFSAIILALNDCFGVCIDDEDLYLAAMVHPKIKLTWIREADKPKIMEKLNSSFEIFSAAPVTRFL